MCRNPCTVCLLQYHLHTLSPSHGEAALRRGGLKEVYSCS